MLSAIETVCRGTKLNSVICTVYFHLDEKEEYQIFNRSVVLGGITKGLQAGSLDESKQTPRCNFQKFSNDSKTSSPVMRRW